VLFTAGQIAAIVCGMNTTTQIALVTGANKGIGRAVARQLSDLGMTVLLGARDAERGRAAAAELGASGDVRHLPLDVTDDASVAAAAEQVRRDFGRLDVLVNNAGISREQDLPPPSAVSADIMRETYETNVFGVVAVTHAFLPLLREAPAARVVNVSSVLGSLATLADPQSVQRRSGAVLMAYNSSKTALLGVTLAYAIELADSPIKVNAANPGYVATDLNNHQGFLTTDQGAAIIVRLATLPDDGPTGAFLSGDGPLPW
jgi:NAD(P)-dependent dehydrogenase (short-subunit alcohol dehydrogenase family)